MIRIAAGRCEVTFRGCFNYTIQYTVFANLHIPSVWSNAYAMYAYRSSPLSQNIPPFLCKMWAERDSTTRFSKESADKCHTCTTSIEPTEIPKSDWRDLLDNPQTQRWGRTKRGSAHTQRWGRTKRGSPHTQGWSVSVEARIAEIIKKNKENFGWWGFCTADFCKLGGGHSFEVVLYNRTNTSNILSIPPLPPSC